MSPATFAFSPIEAAPAFKTGPGRPGHDGRVKFDTKIAIAVADGLAAWQKLNVTAFLASSVAGGIPGVMGEPYEDGSGNAYLPMFREPVLVYAAHAAALSRVRGLAVGRGLAVAV